MPPANQNARLAFRITYLGHFRFSPDGPNEAYITIKVHLNWQFWQQPLLLPCSQAGSQTQILVLLLVLSTDYIVRSLSFIQGSEFNK